jgi:hypothetical protein
MAAASLRRVGSRDMRADDLHFTARGAVRQIAFC